MSAPLPFRPGVAAGGWLAVSGQVGLKDGVLADGARAQTAQALANLREVVESHGAGLAEVVKTNVFLVSMDDYPVMNEEYAKVFAREQPARSAVAVHQLPLGALVEIEAWVHLPAR
jgi:2-iminobutanoate/2-iminopropanoate deaminase